MAQVMNNVAATTALIQQGKRLVIAGDEKVLRQLPRGTWIGGSIPYFIGDQGGEFSQERLLVTELPACAEKAVVQIYDEKSISKIYADTPAGGYAVLMIPAMSKTHLSFAVNAPSYVNFAARPLIGWISGVNLVDLGKVAPKVFVGETGQIVENGGVAMMVSLPKNKVADIGIVNIFKQGTGDSIQFEQTGFTTQDVLINGKRRNLAEYLTDIKANTQLPLVADYLGAMVNISFQNVDVEKKTVSFYAPVFNGVEYKLAAPVGDYVREFASQIPSGVGQVAFSCNCILNYLYSQLDGKKTGDFVGPITFGEIAYQLLNQTMVYLTIQDAVT
jgi:hypothetical protein